MQLTLTRDPNRSDDSGTFGTMAIDGEMFCYTAEQPWNDNKEGQSCVPLGDYALIPYISPKNGPTVVLHNPALGIYGPDLEPKPGEPGYPGRTVCEIHAANWPSELEGCIAVGQSYVTDLGGQGPAVTASQATFAVLKAKWGDRTGLTLSIVGAPG